MFSLPARICACRRCQVKEGWARIGQSGCAPRDAGRRASRVNTDQWRDARDGGRLVRLADFSPWGAAPLGGPAPGCVMTYRNAGSIQHAGRCRG